MARTPKRASGAKKAGKKASRQRPSGIDNPKQILQQFAELAGDGLRFNLPGKGPLSPGESGAMLETLMRGLLGSMGDSPSNPAHDRAMALCDEAKHSPAAKAKKLASKALDVWPDCTEAHNILAELADAVSEALPHYEKAVAAGRRALADEWESLRADDAFWGYLPTRPFMRALAGLADALWAIGRRDDAADCYLELLMLNPGDNQGIRDVAVPRLLEMDRNDDAKRILSRYPDLGDCFTLYNTALVAFREHGTSVKAKRAIKKAIKANEHVPSYLAGNQTISPRRSDSYSLQSPEEAEIYVSLAQRAWKSTPGAIGWLRANWSPDGAPLTDVASLVERSEYDGPLSALPVIDDESWILACQQMDSWVRGDDGQLARPWATLVLGPTSVLASEVTIEPPGEAAWRVAVRTAIASPALDSLHRPARVVVRSNDHRLMLEPLLDGIPCHVKENGWDAVDAIFEDLSQATDERSPLMPYVKQAGMTVERVGHFFETAATFYRRAPWTFTPTDAVWEVQPAGLKHPWFAIVIGQNGETYGLSLVEHFDDCRRMMTGELINDDLFGVSAMCLNFDEAHTMTGPDIDAADQFGWAVAAPEAYPLVYRTGSGESLETPTSQDFDLLEASLQTLPDFILGGQDMGLATTVVNGRRTEVRLARVALGRLRKQRRR